MVKIKPRSTDSPRIREALAQLDLAPNSVSLDTLNLLLSQGHKRACGECTACCTVLSVHDAPGGYKPRQQKCAHESEKGCGIYESRPFSCRDFFCGWKSGLLPSAARPDRVGLVVWMSVTSDGVSWVMDECTPGAAQSPKGKALIRELSERRPLICYQPNGEAIVMHRGVRRGTAYAADDQLVAEMARQALGVDSETVA